VAEEVEAMAEEGELTVIEGEEVLEVVEVEGVAEAEGADSIPLGMLVVGYLQSNGSPCLKRTVMPYAMNEVPLPQNVN
jgi:hypothetical protein